MRYIGLINNIRLKAKMIAFYGITCAIPIAVLGIMLILFNHHQVLAQYMDAVKTKQTYNKASFSRIIYLAADVSADLQIDSELRTLLSSEYDTEINAISAQRKTNPISKFLRSYPEIAYIHIYTYNDMLYSLPYVRITEEIEQQPWFRQAKDSYGTINWYVSELKNDCRLYLIRKMPLPDGNFAVIQVGLSDTYLKLQFSGNEYNTLFLLDDKPFYADPASHYAEDWTDYPFESGAEPIVADWMGAKSILQCSNVKSSQTEQKFTIVTADTHSYSAIRIMNSTLSLVLVILLAAALVVIYIFTNTIEKRIKILQKQAGAIVTGELQVQDVLPGDDELGQLFKDLVRVICIMQEMNQEIYRKEIDKQKSLLYQKELEYKLLTNQIHPHFLFNTIENIHMKAVINGDREVATMIRQLSVFLRRLLQISDHISTLSSEIDLITGYLNIQKFRYPDRFSYDIQVDQDINPEEQSILPLLLLPIVENAVMHGLENTTRNGYVQITIKVDAPNLRIIVRDNGSGMDEETCEKLRERIRISGQDLQGKSIGLYNVNQRIGLYYGSQYGLQIYSKLNAGTEIVMTFPMKPLEVRK